MLLIKNIKGLLSVLPEKIRFVAGADMARMQVIENAYLIVDNGLIVDFGEMSALPKKVSVLSDMLEETTEIIDATGKYVLPAFCDSHTHIVYVGSRETEFVDKIKGLSYEEIYKRGGGILNSAERLRNTGENELFESAMQRL
ncbi:MAG: imidazolonepropionase, partial [Bacteroidales bacterium]|nr:imidazolonepropionase [Bacteroidales bacterium]